MVALLLNLALKNLQFADLAGIRLAYIIIKRCRLQCRAATLRMKMNFFRTDGTSAFMFGKRGKYHRKYQKSVRHQKFEIWDHSKMSPNARTTKSVPTELAEGKQV